MKVSSIIKTPVARKIASTAMLLSASMGITNVSANNNKTQNQNSAKTELVSKETAKALSSYVLINQKAQRPVRQLESVRSSLQQEYLEPHLSEISAAYDSFGEFGGVAYESYVLHVLKSAEIMENIKNNYQKLLSPVIIEYNGQSYDFRPKLLEQAQEYVEGSVRRPLNYTPEVFEEKYTLTEKMLTQYLSFCFNQTASLVQSNANYQEYIDAIDASVVQLSKELNDTGMVMWYENGCREFERQQQTQGLQKQVDLLAFKIWQRSSLVIDRILNITKLREASVYVLSQELSHNGGDSYFDRMHCLCPRPNP